MKLEIKYLGELAEKCQRDSEIVNAERGTTLKRIVTEIEERHDLQGAYYRVSVNRKLNNDDNYLVQDRDEIALLPPFAGG